MNTRTSTFTNVIISFLFCLFFTAPAFSFSWTVGKPPMPDVKTATEITVNLESPKAIAFLSRYQGQSIKSQFRKSSGVVFSACPVSVLPADLNRFPSGSIIYNGDTPANEADGGKLYNPWEISFSQRKVSFVEITLLDRDDNTSTGPVTHHMYVFDQKGEMISDVGWFDDALIAVPMVFSFNAETYSLTHPGTVISKVLFDSEPFSEREVSKIVYRYLQ